MKAAYAIETSISSSTARPSFLMIPYSFCMFHPVQEKGFWRWIKNAGFNAARAGWGRRNHNVIVDGFRAPFSPGGEFFETPAQLGPKPPPPLLQAAIEADYNLHVLKRQIK
ncbi:MAG: hypothetical protein H2060_11000 [Azoarcus sp.]|nr:hypothetical protein [Azoarcus sp.]